MILRSLVLAGLLAVGLGGCYTTRIHTGMQGTTPSLMATDRWHHAIVNGLAELSDPVDLEGVCPGGWSAINEQVSFVNGLATVVTWGIYTPRTYTVTCGTGAPSPAGAGWGAAGAPPPNWGAPPAPAPAPPK